MLLAVSACLAIAFGGCAPRAAAINAAAATAATAATAAAAAAADAAAGPVPATGAALEGTLQAGTAGAALKSAAVPAADEVPGPGVLDGKVIVVDPGHGGGQSNGGATGVTGLKEKDANLAIGLALKQAFETAGARVIMTRTTDDRPWIPGHPELDQLQARQYIAAHSGADLFISIHANWSPDPDASGLETYYYTGNQTEEQLAATMLADISKTTGMPARFAAGRHFAVLHDHPVPATLLELGYVSNAQDEANLRDPGFRKAVVEGIVDGARDYFAAR